MDIKKINKYFDENKREFYTNLMASQQKRVTNTLTDLGNTIKNFYINLPRGKGTDGYERRSKENL
jgi:hypothetical protein